MEQLRSLWQDGALFHVSSRYPRREDLPRVDRLAGILRQGLIAPGSCEDGSVRSDLRMEVRGTPIPYDTLVFLHRFGEPSFLYIPMEPGRFAVFLDPDLPVLTPQTIGEPWVMLSQDEVYVRDRVAPESFTALAVHRVEADAILKEFEADLQRLRIPVYAIEGHVLWQPG